MVSKKRVVAWHRPKTGARFMLITIPNCHSKIIFVICWNIIKLLTLPKLNSAQETISFCFDEVLLVLQSVQSKLLLFSAITHLIHFIRYIVLNRNQAVCITINVLAVGPHPSSESLYPLNSLKAIKLINGTWRMRITQNLSLMQFLSHCLVSLLFLLSSVSHCQTRPVPQIPLFPNQADPMVMYYSFRDSIPFKYGCGPSFPLLAAQSCQHLFL